MTSLLDIVPIKINVKIRGQDYPVCGINVEGIAYLLRRFPIIGNVMTNATMRSQLSAGTFLALAPEIVAAIIATGLGHEGEEYEKALLNLSFGEQIECIEKILEVTMPQGVRPFVESLKRLGNQVGASGWESATTSAEEPSN